jgi:hypothetical protein
MLVREALATQLLQRPNGFQETAQGEVSPFGVPPAVKKGGEAPARFNPLGLALRRGRPE